MPNALIVPGFGGETERLAKQNAYHRAYRAANREKRRAYEAKWRAANPVKVKCGHDKYRAVHHERERTLERERYAAQGELSTGRARRRSAEWRQQNPNYYTEWRNARIEQERAADRRDYAANVERERAKDKAWAARNPDATAAKCARRRAAQRSAPGNGISRIERREILDASLGICAYCNERKTLTLDHIEPLVNGGAHDVSNSAAACRSCNASKNDAPLIVWLARRRLPA